MSGRRRSGDARIKYNHIPEHKVEDKIRDVVNDTVLDLREISRKCNSSMDEVVADFTEILIQKLEGVQE